MRLFSLPVFGESGVGSFEDAVFSEDVVLVEVRPQSALPEDGEGN
jgi:hypothetical protein